MPEFDKAYRLPLIPIGRCAGMGLSRYEPRARSQAVLDNVLEAKYFVDAFLSNRFYRCIFCRPVTTSALDISIDR